jgi:predicted Zn finger-like uncharacterized protein
MALATQCPHCGTMFRVASDQLKLRGGIVRCGSCQEIFDGSATLVDLDALPARAPVAVTPEAPAPSPAPSVPEPDALPVQAEASAEAPSAPIPEEEPLAPLDVAVALPNFDDQPVYTLDFDHTFDPFGILPKVDAPEPAPAPAPDDTAVSDEAPQPALQPWTQLLKDPEPVADAVPSAAPAVDEAPPESDEPVQPVAAPHGAYDLPPARDGRIEPAFGLPVDEELVAAPLPGHEPEPEPASPDLPARSKAPAADAPPPLLRESPPSAVTHPAAAHIPPVARTPAAKRLEKAAARRSKLTPTRIESQPKLRAAEIDEPEFVKRGRQQEQSGRTRKIALVAGSLALLVLLFAQGVLNFRNALAARFPAAKPALVSGCAMFGCRVELPAQIDNLAIETGELTTLGGGAYSFTTELRNAGGTAQAWPSLELALTDANDKPLVRRVFAPSDYLAAGTPVANGIAPRAEQAIKLHFRVDDLKPSGYHIAVFYP